MTPLSHQKRGTQKHPFIVAFELLEQIWTPSRALPRQMYNRIPSLLRFAYVTLWLPPPLDGPVGLRLRRVCFRLINRNGVVSIYI